MHTFAYILPDVGSDIQGSQFHGCIGDLIDSRSLVIPHVLDFIVLASFMCFSFGYDVRAMFY